MERMNGGFNSTMQIQAELDAEDEDEMLASLTLESQEAATAEVRRRAQILSHGSSATPETDDNDDEYLMQFRDDALRISYDEADDWLRKGKPGQRPAEDGDEDMAERIANDVAVNAIFAQVDGGGGEGEGEGEGIAPDSEELDEIDQEEADEDEYAREMQREMMELMPEAARPEEPHRPQTASAREVEQELEREVERMISEDEDEDDDVDGTVRRPKDGSSGGKAQVFTLDGNDDVDGDSECEEQEQQASMEASIAAAVESADTAARRVDVALPPGALPLRLPSGFGAARMTPRNDLDPDSEMNFVASLRDSQMADFVNKSAKERLGTPGRPGSRGGSLTPLQPLGQGLAGTIRPGSRGLSR